MNKSIQGRRVTGATYKEAGVDIEAVVALDKEGEEGAPKEIEIETRCMEKLSGFLVSVSMI